MVHQKLVKNASKSVGVSTLLMAKEALAEEKMADGMTMPSDSANRITSPGTLLGATVFLIGISLIVGLLLYRRQSQDRNPSHLAKKSMVSAKTILTLGVFAMLLGGISMATSLLKPTSSMAGMQGMEGMSMDQMMQVDGSSNSTPVTVESVKPGLLEASVRYTGSVRPYQEVTVYPRLTGQLTNYSVYSGNRVTAGEVLAQLSANEFTAGVNEAVAESEAARSELQASRAELDENHQQVMRMAAESAYWDKALPRSQILLNKGVISQEEFDKDKSQAAVAKANLRETQVKLERLSAQINKAEAQVAQANAKARSASITRSYTVITSPLTGIVEERMIDTGAVVQPGMGILKIGDYSKVRLQANVAQQEVIGIKIGSPIEARLRGESTAPLTGYITSIFPKAGEETRTITVEAIVKNPENRILAGQFLEMRIVTARKPNALSIPQAALTESDGKQAVWVVAGKSAKREFVTTGLTSGDRLEVTSGLEPGELVITSGQERLVENSKVLAVNDSGQPVASLGSAAPGNTRVQLVSPKGKAVVGDNQLVLEVQDSKTGKPLQVDALDVSVAMPMKNAAPMSTDVAVKPDSQPGRFKVNTYLGMSGTWEVTAKVKDKSRSGSGSFTVNNR